MSTVQIDREIGHRRRVLLFWAVVAKAGLTVAVYGAYRFLSAWH